MSLVTNQALSAVETARARLIEALDLLDSLRPLLNNKDAAEWETVWGVAYTEALNRAREYIETAAAAASAK